MEHEDTPRPWSSPWRIHRIEEAFEVFWYDGEEGVDSYTYVATARQYDNAKLIAAAPEMLAVLRAVRASISDSLAAFAVPVNDSLSDALDAIDATINDATMKEEA